MDENNVMFLRLPTVAANLKLSTGFVDSVIKLIPLTTCNIFAIDLENVKYLNYSSMKALIFLSLELKRKGIRVIFFQLNPLIIKMLLRNKLYRLMTIAKSKDDVMKMVSAEKAA